MNLSRRETFSVDDAGDRRLFQLENAYADSADHILLTDTDGARHYILRSIIEENERILLRKLVVEEMGLQLSSLIGDIRLGTKEDT